MLSRPNPLQNTLTSLLPSLSLVAASRSVARALVNLLPWFFLQLIFITPTEQIKSTGLCGLVRGATQAEKDKFACFLVLALKYSKMIPGKKRRFDWASLSDSSFAQASHWVAYMLRHKPKPALQRKTRLPCALRKAVVLALEDGYKAGNLAKFYGINVLMVKTLTKKKSLWEGANKKEVADFRDNGSSPAQRRAAVKAKKAKKDVERKKALKKRTGEASSLSGNSSSDNSSDTSINSSEFDTDEFDSDNDNEDSTSDDK
ncbi:hypothetical protein Rhopal_007215-T1 [Rhodotorula paludigena]|uniref:Uncharacterized protein n=1 Tax=Rhodotorula paludigena TaxID=86838 RepID=A0AAV5GNH4_9BASI|nr:hypothetical protein Rhopal_007215-T1 [Rhodotorula paludigena]